MLPAIALEPRHEELGPEAHAILSSEADGHTGRVPPALVASHLVRATEGGDLPLRRAALEALLRRLKSMREASESWSIESRPRSGSKLGAYRVRVGKGRAYRVWLRSFSALEGSCDCADFARNGLGLCKHLYWLLERGFSADGSASPDALPPPELAWDPAAPLSGSGDWLERLAWTADALPPALKASFEPRSRPAHLKSTFAEAPVKRLALVRALQGAATDSALARLLEDEEAALRRRTEGALSDKALDAALASLERKLFPYQREGVRRFVDATRLLLADDMGLGKTAQAIAASHVLYTTDRVRRGLVVVPAALKAQWAREWSAFTRTPVAVVDGPPEARARQYRQTKSGFLIINYEQVLKDLDALLRFAPDLVVLDEAQRIKNWAAKTSLCVKRLNPTWRLMLSGTPLENRLGELASLMEWVDDRALEPKWALPEWYAVRGEDGRDVVGAKNLGTLRQRLQPSTLRRVRKEVLSQLPPRTDVRVPVDLTPEQAVAHDELDAPIARLLSTTRRRPLTQPEFLRLMSLMQQQRVICNGLAQRDFEQVWPELEGSRVTEARLRGLFSPKLLELRELVSSLVLTQGLKVVVFSHWKRMLKLASWAVSDLLDGAGLRAVFFTGDESQKRRTQNVADFHDDPRSRVFFATDAGGVGLNLQRAASACVHLDLPWNPAVLEQRSGRIYRLGQTNPVEIYALVSGAGIESRIASIVGDKKALFDGVFDGSTEEVRFEKGGSFLSTLQEVAAAPVAEATPDDEEPGDAPALEDGGSDAVVIAPVAPVAPGAAELLSGIRVQRLADGRLVLEAEPRAAETFAAMLEGVAALLKQAAKPPGQAG